jgi:hypothetical protein
MTEGNSHTHDIEGHIGNKEPTNRSEDNPRGKVDQTSSVGATARASRKYVNNIGKRERRNGIGTLRKHTSVEGARHSAHHGDLGRTKRTRQEASG